MDMDSDGRAIASVMRAIGLVEDRMAEDIGVADMAEAACYSPFYFSRLFSRATGHAPYDYLMRRRVAASAEDVVSGSRSLIEVGMEHGFEVPDTFARAFRRCFGISPSDARKRGEYPRKIARARIERPFVEAMLGGRPPSPAVASRGGRVVVGSWSAMGGDPIGAIAEATAARSAVLLVERDEMLNPSRLLSGKASETVEGYPDSPPPFPLVAACMPAGRYARFRVEAADILGFVVEFAYRVWLPSVAGSRDDFEGCPRDPDFDALVFDESGLSLELPLEPPKAY
jgi:AraC-type DNA-binding domain-containing proteins